MVVDCGGGTVDITVHELDINEKLIELHKASGGPFGAVGMYRVMPSIIFVLLFSFRINTKIITIMILIYDIYGMYSYLLETV